MLLCCGNSLLCRSRKAEMTFACEQTTWITILLGLGLVYLCTAVRLPFVAGPSTEYIVLSSPFPVQYSLGSKQYGFNEVLSVHKKGEMEALSTVSVQQGMSEGIVQFPCGVVSSAGQYVVRLNRLRLLLAESQPITAVWPTFNLSLPSLHTAQEEVHPLLEIKSVNRVMCRQQDAALNFSLEVEFSQDEGFAKVAIVHRESDLVLRKSNSAVLPLRCEIFDRAGYFRAVIRITTSNKPIAMSSSMYVQWGDYYRLSSAQESVFPCVERLVIQYTRPKCITQSDNIHMYAARPSKQRGERDLDYLYEAKAAIGQSSASFDCKDLMLYQWRHNVLSYCFKYQTVANNQAVTDHGLFCLPSNLTVGLSVDGAWSVWEPWSECSGKCDWGRQSRIRYCNNPSPANGGRFCQGSVSVEWQECRGSCNNAPSSMPTLPSTTRRPLSREPECWCGCTMSRPFGVIIPGSQCLSTQSGYKVHTVWVIQAPGGATVQLNITEFSWTLAGQILKVRDGPGYDNLLLVDLRGNLHVDSQYITSSKNNLQLEFLSMERVPQGIDLFVATYRFIFNDIPPNLDQVAAAQEKVIVEPKWRLPVIIAGSIGGFVIIMLIVGVSAYTHISRAQSPTKPNKSRSAMSNISPNHVVIQVQDGEYTNFGDVTLAASVQTNGPEQSRQKKRGRNKETPAELPDPYNVKPEDFIHDCNLLHVQEMAKTHRKSKKARRRAMGKKPMKKTKQRHGHHVDPREVDRLINSLPGVYCHERPPLSGDKDSEYRALINQLSTSDSQQHSDCIVNTSAELHQVPHTTPVENSMEITPLVSPAGQRSPCLDDGYTSLANTGSTQSNLSRPDDLVSSSALPSAEKRSTSKSRGDLESLSPIRSSKHSSNISVVDKSINSRITSPLNLTRHTDLQTSHLTCPLPKPDGDSDVEANCHRESPLTSNQMESPYARSLSQEQSLLAPPPPNFADLAANNSQNRDSISQSHSDEDNEFLPPPFETCSAFIEIGPTYWPKPPTDDIAL